MASVRSCHRSFLRVWLNQSLVPKTDPLLAKAGLIRDGGNKVITQL